MARNGADALPDGDRDDASDVEPEEAEEADENQITIKKSWHVMLPGGKVWSPDFKEVNDSVYLKIGKYDRVLGPWITGKTLDMSKSKETSLQCKAWASLIVQRKAASVSAVCTAKGGQHSQRVVESDMALVDPHVHVELGSVTCRVLWGIGRDPHLWMEFSPTNLYALKKVITESKATAGASPKKKPRGRKPK